MKALLLTLFSIFILTAACGGKDSASDGAGSVDSAAAVDSPAAAPSAPDSSVAVDTPTDTRLIVASVVDLQVQSLGESYRTIAQIARDFGGFVAEARFADSGDESGKAFLRLRVPAVQHDALVASLRGLEGAAVTREESNAREVSAEYTDLQSRLLNLQHTEAQYQQLLGRAGTIDDVLKVTARLDAVRGDVEKVRGQINLLEDKSDFATVSANLALPPAGAHGTSGGLPSPVKVFVTSLEASLVVAHAILNAAVVLLVAGLWLIPATGLGLLAWKRLRRPLATVRTWFA